jgi:hypothetical protein
MENKNEFFRLVEEIEYTKAKLEELYAQFDPVLASLPKDTLFQDEITGLVYKVVKPSGTFVHYRDLDYVRTAKNGERAGSLSKKEAESNGFKV